MADNDSKKSIVEGFNLGVRAIGSFIQGMFSRLMTTVTGTGNISNTDGSPIKNPNIKIDNEKGRMSPEIETIYEDSPERDKTKINTQVFTEAQSLTPPKEIANKETSPTPANTSAQKSASTKKSDESDNTENPDRSITPGFDKNLQSEGEINQLVSTVRKIMVSPTITSPTNSSNTPKKKK